MKIQNDGNVLGRIQQIFHDQHVLDKVALEKCIQLIDAKFEELKPFLSPAGDKPYGRRLLYKDPRLEVLVMNWRNDLECFPHDHGESIGFVKIIRGAVKHTVYSLKSGKMLAAETTIENEGNLIFAPMGLIHKMANADYARDLTTLHFYTPPITGMEVFDEMRQLSCTVSDDCGAWWPEGDQLIEVKQGLERKSSAI